MHYEVSKDGLILQSLVNLQTFKVFQGLYSSHILKHAFDFWLAEKYFELSWKSILAKTGPAKLFQLLSSMAPYYCSNACSFSRDILSLHVNIFCGMLVVCKILIPLF